MLMLYTAHHARRPTTTAARVKNNHQSRPRSLSMETDPFSRALAVLASPTVDPNACREAETFVTAASEDPAVVLVLLKHLDPAAAVAPETRHLVAVLLANSAGKHWRSLDDASRRAMQTCVLAALANAEDPATLRALAHAADVVAQSSTTSNTPWDELLPSLSEAARSPKDAHREAASLLLGNLVESMGPTLKDHHPSLVDLFVEASKDETNNQSSNASARRRARRAALGALAQLATALGSGGDFPLVATLAPRIVQRCLHAAGEYSSKGDLVGVAAALRALAAAVSVDADAVFGDDLALLYPAAETTLAVATRGYVGSDVRVVADADQDMIDDTRAAAFEALEALASTHSGALDEPVPSIAAAAAAAGVSAKSAPPTIAAMLLPPLYLAARGDGSNHFGNDDSETRGVAAAARAALRQCALRFPPSVVLPHVLRPVVDAGLKNVSPSEGALGAFAVVIEGCAHNVADNDTTVRHILTALRCGVESGDAATARAAASVLSELMEHAGHALASLHTAQVAGLLVVAISLSTETESRLGQGGNGDDVDLVEGFAAPAHSATVSFVENCGDEELDGESWRALAASLVSGACADAMPSRGRARCLGTLAAVATAAAAGFEPYAGETLQALATLAGAAPSGVGAGTGEEAADAVRARTLAAMAAVVSATGEHVAPPGTVDALLDAATRRLSEGLSSSTSRECALRVFARLAIALDRRLAPWLPGATAAAIAVLEVSVGAEAAPGGGRRGRTAVTTGDIGEAIAAAETLGALANCCGAAARGTAALVLASLVAAAEPEGSAPPALRIAALRALEFATHPADEEPDTGNSAMAVSAPEAAAALFADTTRALADSLARDDVPEAALAAATSLETVAERCRGVAVALAAAPALASLLNAAVAEAAEACDAVQKGVANCQAELADGGGGGHEGRDGEDTVDVFFDLEDQAKRVVARLR